MEPRKSCQCVTNQYQKVFKVFIELKKETQKECCSQSFNQGKFWLDKEKITNNLKTKSIKTPGLDPSDVLVS